jgi:uncharacterized SAM-dependent methyltransferase
MVMTKEYFTLKAKFGLDHLNKNLEKVFEANNLIFKSLYPEFNGNLQDYLDKTRMNTPVKVRATS